MDEMDAAFRTRCSFRLAGNEMQQSHGCSSAGRHSPRKFGSESSYHCPVFEAWLISLSFAPLPLCCLLSRSVVVLEAERCMYVGGRVDSAFRTMPVCHQNFKVTRPRLRP